MKHRLLVFIRSVNISAVGHQGLTNVDVSLQRSLKQRRISVLVKRVDLDARLDQRLNNIRLALLTRLVQRSLHPTI